MLHVKESGGGTKDEYRRFELLAPTKSVGLRGCVRFNKYAHLRKNCTSIAGVSPLSRMIQGFRNDYH